MAVADRRIVAGAGALGLLGAVGGVLLVIAGLVLHFHNSSLSAACGSTLGQLGQGVDPQAQASCNQASGMSDLGWVLVIFGVLLLIGSLKFGGGALLALLEGGTSATPQPQTVREGTPSRLADPTPQTDEQHPFGCYVCGKSFVSQEKLTMHARAFHPGQDVSTPPPREAVPAPVALTEPQTPASPDDPNALPCPECNRVLATQDKLDQHRKNFHPRDS